MSDRGKERRARGDGALYQDVVTGRWIGKLDLGRGPDGRRRQRKVIGRTKSEVSRRLRELRKQAGQGVEVGRQAPRVEQVVNDWFAKAAVERKSEATLARLRRRLDQHIIPGVGHHRIDQLRADAIEVWLEREAARGQARATLQQYRGDLRQVLKWALARDLVVRNAAEAAHIPHGARDAVEKRAFTWDELDALYSALDDDRMGPYFVVLAELGLRNQEADALAWADVDLEGRRVQIHRAMKRGDGGVPIGIGALKAARTSRPSRLSQVAVAALRRQRARQAIERMAVGELWSNDDRWVDLVFTTELGTPLNPSNVRRAFRSACRRAGVRELTPYEAGRHTTASLMIDAGATPTQVAAQLGHRSTRMLERHYQHRVAEEVSTAADVMDARRSSMA